MAKVHNNIFVRRLTGAVGDQFVIRKTIIANKPVFDEDREFSEAQKAQQAAFKKAHNYAKGAKTQPVYVALAKGTDATPSNMAMADWFGKPEVLEIVTGGWTGEIGHTILIRAQDDTQVNNVQVVIHSDGGVLEQGEAVRSEVDGLLWTYVTTVNATGCAPLNLDANAYDLPGNVGALTVSLN